MIPDLKSYPSYRDSGVPWLGDVPEHWEVKRGKNLFQRVDIRSATGQEELLTVSSDRGVIPRRSATVTMFKAESYVGHKLCWPGDLVINSLWAWSRGLGVSQYHGIVSTAYGVYRPRAGSETEPRFIHELSRSTPFQWELQVRSKGIWTSRLQLTDDSFLDAPFPVPSLGEQAAIVRFLAHADRRILRYILAKQKLIKLLQEQKQAIVHHAVTHGHPSIRRKPSGTKWLGDVPQHWEVLRLKHLITGIEQGWSPQCDAQPAGADEWGVLKVGCVNRDYFDDTQNKKLPAALSPIPALEVRNGDILVSRANTRELLGLAAVVQDVRPRLLLCDKLFRFRPLRQRACDRFLVAMLRDKSCRAQIETSTNGASDSMQNIGQGVIRNLWIAAPPLAEQHQLVEAIDIQTASLTRAVARARRKIDLLREYRTRLIADVITGKFDVRDAAAKLPDEPGETEEMPPGDEALEGGGDAELVLDDLAGEEVVR